MKSYVMKWSGLILSLLTTLIFIIQTNYFKINLISDNARLNRLLITDIIIIFIVLILVIISFKYKVKKPEKLKAVMD
jgi:hypothetical protein